MYISAKNRNNINLSMTRHALQERKKSKLASHLLKACSIQRNTVDFKDTFFKKNCFHIYISAQQGLTGIKVFPGKFDWIEASDKVLL